MTSYNLDELLRIVSQAVPDTICGIHRNNIERSICGQLS